MSPDEKVIYSVGSGILIVLAAYLVALELVGKQLGL